MTSLPLALTLGDPAGVGPACTFKAWQAHHTQSQYEFCLVADPSLVMALAKANGFDGSIVEISDPNETSATFAEALPILRPSMSSLKAVNIRPGKPTLDAAPHILASIEEAVSLALSDRVRGVVTNPISKALLYDVGFKHPGHTEFLAQLCQGASSSPITPVMMLAAGGLKVALATIHIPISAVPESLSKPALLHLSQIVLASLKRDFALSEPRLAIAGLNPHAGEDGSIGKEEIEIINPVSQALRDLGYNVSDARPGDTVFHEALSGEYDAVIAMFHDQGLVAVKTHDFWNGVNITLGLPIVRTSPDHGTGYQAAASGKVRADSLIAAIGKAHEIASNRAASADE